MVQIHRSNMPRRVRGSTGGGYGGINIPYLSRLSPADRILLLIGAGLFSVASFSYFFLISGILSSSSIGIGGLSSSSYDPRLSPELRKTGLSEEALLRRGGGRRISIGPNKLLDSNENAMALDIASTLHCDALQEEMEREWQTILDEQKIHKTKKISTLVKKKTSTNAKSWEAGAHDDYAGELAREIQARMEQEQARGGGGVGVGGGGTVHGDDFFPIEPSDKQHRRLLDNNYGYGHDQYHNQDGLKLTGRHLFCLAAEALTLPKQASSSNPPSIHCDINSFETREELLNLWSSARSQMPEEIISKTLRVILEHKETIRGHEVYLWYPEKDQGTEGMLRVLNSGFEGRDTYNFDTEPADKSHDDLYRFHDLPSKLLGPNKLFVDVGSALGLTSILMSFLYPETTIVSIEPASPSWLIQNINYRCNLSHNQLQYVHPILAGIGTKHHDDNDSMMKMVWRPSMTTATRSWQPEKDYDFASDMEIVVRLRTLRVILAEATPEDLPLGTPISVLNLDCEGCEYNLIPSMHDTSFNSIEVILGRTNWGYIPTIKKPSSDRARETHTRVCTHYNFAKRCKECCDFPSLLVKPRLPNSFESSDSLLKELPVSEVAGSLCDNFEKWAMDSKLHDIPEDYGWNELSAFASDK